MKKFPVAASAIKLTPKKLASLLLIASAGVTQASIIANEGFDYSTGALVGQTGTGIGFTGNWGGNSGFTGPTSAFTVTSGSLAMNGVASSGGKLSYSTTSNLSTGLTRAFSAPLSTTSTLYGSYLIRVTADSFAQGRASAGVLTGLATENDNTATFVWAANGFNSSTTAPTQNVEAPNIRVEGTGTALPTFSLSLATTYVMLFEFNATSKTTSAWLLNEAQLTNFYGSLNSTTLNAATGNTNAASGVVWKGTATSTGTLGSMTNLSILGFASTQGALYGFDMDEIRFSDTSLSQVVAVPEPSTVAFGVALGALAFGRVLRRRRNV